MNSRRFAELLLTFAVICLSATLAFGQSTATLRGTVTDNSGAVVTNANVTARNLATGVERSVTTDTAGAYQLPALPPGNYELSVQAQGMQQYKTQLALDVNRTVEQNVKLGVGQVSEVVNVTAEAPIIESSTITVGKVINETTVQNIPLNGRHFVDLALLTPGTVVPPANGFLTAPLRGQGSFGVNTAGTREDTVNFQVNGINLSDMANGQITFQPSINTVSEFKMDNSTYSAESGRNGGAIVNIATRSGTNTFHGEAFEFLRNDFFDARNFFNKKPVRMSPFKRNQFGGNFGGPIIKNKTFFFGSYEGLRQRQGLTINSTVFTAAQRAQVTAANNATLNKLMALVPAANDATGSRFIGSAVAPVDIDQGTGDIQHNIGQNDRVHGYYVFQRDVRKEPTLQGGNIPGAGDTRQSHRQIFTLNESHTFTNSVVNEARFGFNRIHITFVSDVQSAGLDPASFGIVNGQSGPAGIPRITLSALGLNWGGIRNFAQGRGDSTFVWSDTVNWLKGNHAFKFGSEVRRFYGNAFTSDPGAITFAQFSDFLAARPTGFAITTGNRPNRRTMSAWGTFAQDSWKLKPYLTLELGLRYEWNFTPGEAFNRMVNFLPDTSSLVQVGTNGYDLLYQQNNKNFEPRVGFAWDMFRNGRTVVRGGYGYAVDQPLPVIPNANPPFATGLTFTPTGSRPTTTFSTLLTDAAGAGLAIAAFDRNYKNGYIQSWNLNVQQQITPTLGMMVGYFGNKGTHLNEQVNLNQILDQTATRTVSCASTTGSGPATSSAQALRPFIQLSSTSPILPGACLGNITFNTGNGNSNYNAMWLTVTKRMSHGLQLDGSYTWSKAMDYNSQNNFGVSYQNAFDPRGDYGLSDYDARHHGTISGLYDLPFKGNRLISGWRLSGILQLQSGNPINVFAGSPASCSATTTPVTCPNVTTAIAAGTGITSFTGLGTIRPDLITTPQIVNQLVTTGSQAGNIQWMTNTVCDPRGGACPSGTVFAIPVVLAGGRNIYHFGNLRRNAITGPDFKNLDFSLAKTTPITERLRTEFRAEVFDVFNHPNFANPGLTTGTSTFGFISATRNPTGDAGSSRQIQLSLKMLF